MSVGDNSFAPGIAFYSTGNVLLYNATGKQSGNSVRPMPDRAPNGFFTPRIFRKLWEA